MKWFQHDTDARNDPKLKALIKAGGMAAYGSYWMLAEFIAHEGQGEVGWGVNDAGGPIGMFDMAMECGLANETELVQFLVLLASYRLIDPDVWRERQIVFMPAMAKRADEYTRKRLRYGKKPFPGTDKGKDTESDQGPDNSPDCGVDVSVPVPVDLDPQVGLPIEGEDQVEALVKIWNTKAIDGLPRVLKVTDERRRLLKTALARHPNLADWEAVILHLNGSDWWRGRGPKGNGHDNWKGDLEYLAKPGKLQAALEKAQASKGAGDGRPRTGTGAGAVDAARGRIRAARGKYADIGS